MDRKKVGWTASIRKMVGSNVVGIVVGSFSDRVDLLTSSGVRSAPPGKVTFEADNVEGDVWTPAGALIDVAARVDLRRAATPPGVTGNMLRKVGLEAVQQQPAQRLGFTHDLFRLGRADLAAQVGTQSLYSTLVGSARLRYGMWDDALIAFADLPAGKYRQRVPEVLAAVAGASGTHSMRPAILQWLRSLPASPLAEAGIRYLTNGQVDELLLNALATAGLISHESRRLIMELATGAPVNWNGTQIPVGGMTVEGIDDLIDIGVLTVDDLPRLQAALPSEAEYLAARLDPGSLSDEAVRRLEFADEASRRRASEPSGRIDHALTLYLDGDDSAKAVLSEAFSATEIEQLGAARSTVVNLQGGLPSEMALAEPFVPFVAHRLLGATLLDQEVPADSAGPRTRALLSSAALSAAVTAAFDADWDSTIRHSRAVLKYSRDERVRDEALNTMACALWQQGHDSEALDALAAAAAGSYTISLVANAAVVARDLDPAQAATYLATLVNEAPSTELKVQAAKTAVYLWLSDEDDSFAELTEDTESLPCVIAEPIRALLVSEIDREEFQSLLVIVRRHDSEWLAKPGALAKSPHARSLAAAYHSAFARDPSEALEVMTRALKAGQNDPWLLEERDNYMGMLIAAMLSSDPVPGAGVLALEAIDSHLPMDEDQRIPLAALAARELALVFAADDDSPGRLNAQRLDLVIWAVAGVDRMSDERRAAGRGLVKDCATAVQWSTLRSVAYELDEIRNLLMGIPSYKLRAAMGEMRPILLSSRTDVLKLYPHVDSKAQSATTDIVNGIDQLLRLG